MYLRGTAFAGRGNMSVKTFRWLRTFRLATSAGPIGVSQRHPLALIYAWLIAVAALDVLLTWVALSLGAIEANPLAARILNMGGIESAAVFKLLCLAVLMAGCQYVLHRKPASAQRVAIVLASIWSLPPLITLAQLPFIL
jgi:hypothetical protein